MLLGPSGKAQRLTDFLDYRFGNGEGLRNIILFHDEDFNFGKPLGGSEGIAWKDSGKFMIQFQDNGEKGVNFSREIEKEAAQLPKVGTFRQGEMLWIYGDTEKIFDYLKTKGFDEELYIERFQEAIDDLSEKNKGIKGPN